MGADPGGFATETGFGVGTENDDRQGSVGPDLLDSLETVQVWHPNVEDGQVRLVFPGQGHRLLTVGGFRHDLVTEV